MPKSPKTVFPAHRGFLKKGYRVRNAKSAAQGHWQGGVAYHRNAISPITKRPFTLLWDINCKDPRFNGAFGEVDRIPLYYEWPCCASFSYRVESQDEIELIQFSGNYQGDDFPYPEFEDSFQRCPIDLEAIPPDVEVFLMRLESQDSPEAWNEKENIAKAESWLGRKVSGHGDLRRQQFGGVPSMTQCDPKVRCPNGNCAYYATYPNKEYVPMRLLAAVHNDEFHGLPMIEPPSPIVEIG